MIVCSIPQRFRGHVSTKRLPNRRRNHSRRTRLSQDALTIGIDQRGEETCARTAHESRQWKISGWTEGVQKGSGRIDELCLAVLIRVPEKIHYELFVPAQISLGQANTILAPSVGHKIEAGIFKLPVDFLRLRNASLDAQKLPLGLEARKPFGNSILGKTDVALVVLQLQIRIPLPQHFEQVIHHSENLFADC